MRIRHFGLICVGLAWLGSLAPATGPYFTIPESKLLSAEFAATNWGGTVVRTDASGDQVLFSFSGLSSSGTGIKDDYPVDTVYGQVLPSHGNGDFSTFGGFYLRVKNIDDKIVAVSLFINTGFTGPSGDPPNDLTNDTFWQSPWVEMAPGEARVLILDFDNAIPWSIEDNKDPHSHGTDGVATALNAYDRTEVSAIGFQVYGNDNAEAALLVGPAERPCLLEVAEDLSGNCVVDLEDLALLAAAWTNCHLEDCP